MTTVVNLVTTTDEDTTEVVIEVATITAAMVEEVRLPPRGPPEGPAAVTGMTGVTTGRGTRFSLPRFVALVFLGMSHLGCANPKFESLILYTFFCRSRMLFLSHWHSS